MNRVARRLRGDVESDLYRSLPVSSVVWGEVWTRLKAPVSERLNHGMADHVCSQARLEVGRWVFLEGETWDVAYPERLEGPSS